MLGSDSFSLFAVGDLMLGDSPKMLGIGVRRVSDRGGGDFLFDKVKKDIAADIIFGNLESILSNIDYDKSSFSKGQLRGSPQMANVLRSVGFNILNVANNHMMQYGSEPFKETCQLLEDLGISIVGLAGSDGWHSKPVILNQKKMKIGFLGYADPDRYGHKPLFSLNRLKNVMEDAARIRNQVDKVVVSLHWGDEFIRCPSPDQRKYAHAIIDSGVDVILGHHPHVIQEIEEYNNGVVCYSLGNFISDMVWNPRTREGIAVKFNFYHKKNRLSDIKKVRIGYDFIPTFEKFHYNDLVSYIDSDSKIVQNKTDYNNWLKALIKDNRNRGHFYLLLNFFRYSPICYLRIWIHSFKSLFGIAKI